MALIVRIGRDRERIKVNKHITNSDPCSRTVCQIRLKGHLGLQWSDWFDGMTISLEDEGDTLITGPVVDQAALHGLLKKVRDLGIPLISVNCIEPDPA